MIVNDDIYIIIISLLCYSIELLLITLYLFTKKKCICIKTTQCYLSYGGGM